jgi:hypothetical protein
MCSVSEGDLLKKYRRIEVHVYRRRVTVVSEYGGRITGRRNRRKVRMRMPSTTPIETNL